MLYINRKQFLQVSAAFLGAAALAACGKAAGDAAPAVAPIPSAEGALYTTHSVTSFAQLTEGLTERLQPLERLGYSGSGNESGFYTLLESIAFPRQDGSHILAYIDYASQTALPLCANAGCTHSDTSCTAYIPATSGSCMPFGVGDKLLLVYGGGDTESYGEAALPHIVQMDGDGSNARVLCRLSAAQKLARPFYTDGSTLYGVMTDTTAQLVAIDLADGSLTVRYTFPPAVFFGVPRLLGCSGSLLLFYSLTAEDHEQFGLFALSVESGQVWCIYAPGELEYATVCDGILYTYSQAQDALYGFDPQTGAQYCVMEKLCAQLSTPAFDLTGGTLEIPSMNWCPAYDGKLWLTIEARDLTVADAALDEAYKIGYFFIDPAAAAVQPLSLFYQDAWGATHAISPWAETETDFLVQYGTNAQECEDTDADGTLFSYTVEAAKLGLIAKADYWAGKANYRPITLSV